MLLPLFGRSLHRGRKITKTFNLYVNPVNHVWKYAEPSPGAASECCVSDLDAVSGSQICQQLSLQETTFSNCEVIGRTEIIAGQH